MPMVRFCTHCEAHAALELLLKEPVEGAPVARPAALTSAREVRRSMSCRRCASECTPDDSGPRKYLWTCQILSQATDFVFS